MADDKKPLRKTQKLFCLHINLCSFSISRIFDYHFESELKTFRFYDKQQFISSSSFQQHVDFEYFKNPK
ncbi:hypothetical protein DERF_011307 [Dermatophagoides farinae]|uniref:Uncharacterized protein n=1 Tax=Dermatophagoides farinae TaxID=6954 RepID=A0A922HSS5_DERFA|nr:hypothetical protein DERF_011307 [Dermatophagoides farinae]